MDKYVSDPKDYLNWSGALYRFWDYALIFEILKDKYNINLANITYNNNDAVFQNLCNNKRINYSNFDIENIFKLPVRSNKYDVVCLLGSLDHVKQNVYDYIQKVCRHVSIGGYIILTTDDQSISKYKTNTVSVDTLLDMSLILEGYGFEFVSSEKDTMVAYNYNPDTKNYPHSLVMKRVGK